MVQPSLVQMWQELDEVREELEEAGDMNNVITMTFWCLRRIISYGTLWKGTAVVTLATITQQQTTNLHKFW